MCIYLFNTLIRQLLKTKLSITNYWNDQRSDVPLIIINITKSWIYPKYVTITQHKLKKNE